MLRHIVVCLIYCYQCGHVRHSYFRNLLFSSSHPPEVFTAITRAQIFLYEYQCAQNNKGQENPRDRSQPISAIQQRSYEQGAVPYAIQLQDVVRYLIGSKLDGQSSINALECKTIGECIRLSHDLETVWTVRQTLSSNHT